MSYGTRIDWRTVALADPTTPLRKKDIEYKPTQNLVDLTVRSILSSVDALDKVVPGLRSTYEVLCEFAHPNAGAALVQASSCQVLPADDTGVMWIEKRHGLHPPVEFVRSFRALLEQILSQFAKSLTHYEGLLQESDSIADEILCQVQCVVRQVVSRHSGLFSAYDPCPCDSGKKLKFCCGRSPT